MSFMNNRIENTKRNISINKSLLLVSITAVSFILFKFYLNDLKVGHVSCIHKNLI